MLDDLRWGFALLTLVLGFGLGLDHIGFDERRWGRLLLLQFLNMLLSHSQLLVQRLIFRLHCAHLLQVLALPLLGFAELLQHLIKPLQYLAELLFQVGYFFFLRHDISISDKGQSEQYRILTSTHNSGEGEI